MAEEEEADKELSGVAEEQAPPYEALPTESQDLEGGASFAAPVGELEPEEQEMGAHAEYTAGEETAGAAEAAYAAGEPEGAEGEAPTQMDYEPAAPAAHLPPVDQHPAPIKVPKSAPNISASPSRLPKVKSPNSAHESYAAAKAAKAAQDLSKNWNPHSVKSENSSRALKKAGPNSSSQSQHSGDGPRSGSVISSPTRAERVKRKGWAEAAAKRQAEAAKRLLASDAKIKAEAEARMEARKAAVRLRIEQEKEAQARLAAKRAAVMAGIQEGTTLGHEEQKDGRHAMRKRVNSPRPLYVRLAEDYERKQQQEEEETRKKLEMNAAIRQVRVQALMNGEVIIRPLPDTLKPSKDEAPPRWNPSYRGPSASPGRDKRNQSPHRSRGTSVNGDQGELLDSDAHSPTGHRDHAMTKEANGMVLYSMHDGEDTGGDTDGQSPLLAGGNRRGKLVTRREREANGRSNNPSRRTPMVDRAVSPFIVDPATHQPTNAPAQDQFWQHSSKVAAGAAPPAGGAAGARRLGALEQAPPPPPASRMANKAANASKDRKAQQQQQQEQHAGEELPSEQQLADAGVDLDQGEVAGHEVIDLGESFAEELPEPHVVTDPQPEEEEEGGGAEQQAEGEAGGEAGEEGEPQEAEAAGEDAPAEETGEEPAAEEAGEEPAADEGGADDEDK